MRIGVIGPDGLDDFARNVCDGLESLGHTAVALGSARPTLRGSGRAAKVISVATDLASKQDRVAQLRARRLVQAARNADVDALITVESLHPVVVAALRDAGRPIALWFPDHVANLGPLWMFSAPYSAVFFKEPLLVERVTALLDIPVFYLPEAANPSIHRPPEHPVSKEPHVAVVGNFYPTRVRLLERLHADGVPLKLFGNTLPPSHRNHPLRALHTGLYVRGPEKAMVFRSAAAVLNNLHPAEVTGVNCRLFEATGCGGTVMTEHRDELSHLFDIGSEVHSFASYGEVLESLRFLIADPEGSTSVGDAAARRTLAEHTYAHRLEGLLTKLIA